MRRWVGLSAAVLAAVVALAGCSAGGAVTSRPTELASGGFVGGQAVILIKPADRKPAAVAEGPSLDGKRTISTGDYPGKVVVINEWASWCGPCRKEAPDLAAASRKTAKTAQFVGLNIRDQRSAALAFYRAVKVPYPSIYDPDSTQVLKFHGDLGIKAIPTTLVVDAKGRSAARITGPVDENTLVQIITDVAAGR